MIVLGVNAFNHDPSACLIRDGVILAAVEEEKISRQKGITDFPRRSIIECLALAGVPPSSVDIVAIPRRHAVELCSHALHMLRYLPKSLNLLRNGSSALDSGVKMSRYLRLKRMLRETLRRDVEIVEVPHHEAHAASVFHQSRYGSSMVVVGDGIAEYDTMWIGEADSSGLRRSAGSAFPDSLGMAYAAATDLMGFRPFDDEWKFMGMAAYGTPRYYEELNNLFTVTSDMRVHLDPELFWFRYYGKSRWFGPGFKLSRLRRRPDSDIGQEHFDFARSFQEVFQDKLMSLFRLIKANHPGHSRLCLSGGIFLNCLFNGKLAAEGLYDEVYVDCNPADSGSALGAACLAYRMRTGRNPESMGHDNRLGRGFAPDEMRSALERSGLSYREIRDPSEVARCLREKGIVGVFQGRGEFGPRALGARSILADPRDPAVKELINSRVKYREHFRPFAPSVLFEKQGNFFTGGVFSPYMSFALRARTGVAEKAPAVIHADGTARIQSVRREQDESLHSILVAFEKETSIPMLLNTSFNIRGEPIVYTPSDAISTFMRANLSHLLLGPYLVKV